MILLLTSLISQQRSCCKISNPRGWALSSVCMQLAVRLEGGSVRKHHKPLGEHSGVCTESLEPAKCQHAATHEGMKKK